MLVPQGEFFIFSFMPSFLWGPGLKLAKNTERIMDFSQLEISSATLGVTSIATGISVAAISILAVGMIAVDSHEVRCQQTQELCNCKPAIKAKGINIP